MSFRIAHLLWFTACCGLIIWLVFWLPPMDFCDYVQPGIESYCEPLFPFPVEHIARSYLCFAVFVAGIFRLNRSRKLMES